MPDILDHQSATSTKLAIAAESGAGKSGSILSLAAAGYNLRIADLDNGLDVVANILRGPHSYGDAAKRIAYKTMTESQTKGPTGATIQSAKVWTAFSNMMNNWDDGTNKFGNISTWGPKDIFVVDSFSFLAKAALNYVLSMNARLGGRPQLQDFLAAQDLLELFLGAIHSDSVKCNVIVMFHIQIITKGGLDHDYLKAIGKALAPVIPTYFNNVIMLRKTGVGAAERRTIHTKTVPGVTLELKSSSPLTVKPSYDQATGLAEYFADLRKGATP